MTEEDDRRRWEAEQEAGAILLDEEDAMTGDNWYEFLGGLPVRMAGLATLEALSAARNYGGCNLSVLALSLGMKWIST